MSGYLSLIEFVPGTKAKAQDVNSNFQAVSVAILEKADKAGNSSQNFSVATATVATHAINKSQLDLLSTDLNSKINAVSTRFCVKSGNVTNGVGDLLGYSGMNVSFKVGGSYPSLVVSNARGTFSTFTSVGTLSMSGKPNGNHNIFINTSGNVYSLANNIYRQASRPTLIEGDVWLNTSSEPLRAIKYTGGSDVEFLDVPLGKVTISSGAITAVETFSYNQNGYDVTFRTQGYRFPDYSSGVSKSWNTLYTAETDGWIYIYGNIVAGTALSLQIDGIDVFYNATTITPQNNANSGLVPVCKNSTYRGIGGVSTQVLKFYPTKGAN